MVATGNGIEKGPKKSANHHGMAKFSCLLIILVPLMLILALVLPLVGEAIKQNLIGSDYCCCSMCIYPEYKAAAQKAQSLRWLSNFIIGGCILLAITIVAVAAIMVYHSGIMKRWSDSVRLLTKTVLGIIMAPLAMLLVATLFYFAMKNQEYYRRSSQAPRNPIYYYVTHQYPRV